MTRTSGFGTCLQPGAWRRPGRGAVLFLNPDAALVDGRDCLARLLRELDADPSVGAVAPALTGDGQEEFQLRKLPTFGSFAREAFLVNRLWRSNPWFRRERYLDRARSEPFDVEQPAAAALMVRREALRSGRRVRPGLRPGLVRGRGPGGEALEIGAPNPVRSVGPRHPRGRDDDEERCRTATIFRSTRGTPAGTSSDTPLCRPD